jgi:hypothetical protein
LIEIPILSPGRITIYKVIRSATTKKTLSFDGGFVGDLELIYDENVEVPFFWDESNANPGEYVAFWEGGNFKFFVKEKQFYPNIDKKFDSKTKYRLLIDRYMPRMFGFVITPNDITPEVVNALNDAVIPGFAFLDDAIENLLLSFDLKTNNDHVLQLLAGYSGTKLKGEQKYWLSQVKNANKIRKKKGTKEGLELALKSVGAELIKITHFWSFTSKFVRTCSFKQPPFILPTPLAGNDFLKVWNNDKETDEFDIVESKDGLTTLSIEPEGVVRIQYLQKDNPDQELEKYLLSQPLADRRNEKDQIFPPKNWDTRLIAEDDENFKKFFQEDHPYVDPIVFGKIQSTFLYGENVYNRETFSGGEKDSTSPRDIDENFVDKCDGRTSQIDVTVKVPNIAYKNIINEILTELLPFHATIKVLKLMVENSEILMNSTDNIFTTIRVKDYINLEPVEILNKKNQEV